MADCPAVRSAPLSQEPLGCDLQLCIASPLPFTSASFLAVQAAICIRTMPYQSLQRLCSSVKQSSPALGRPVFKID